MSKTRNVLLVEDHTIVRQGLKRLLEERGINVVGEAGDGYQAVRVAKEKHPDIVIMDISLPKLGGIDATRRIKKELPGTKVLMLTVHSEENYIFKSLDAGASGYLLKDTVADELVSAIEVVERGEIFVSSSIPRRVVDEYREMVRKGKRIDEFSKLTNREREILKLISEGYTNKQIAEMLFISVKTVDNHRANIMNKLDIHDTAGLVRYAIRIGLVDS